MPQLINTPRLFQQAFDVSHETVKRLEIYADLLGVWQKAVNLVAPSTLDQIWHRHIADSAQLAALVPADAATFADLGSGGGFPGLVLAIMLAEHRPVCMTLIESDVRKGAFLREVIRQTGLKQIQGNVVEICADRIEKPATQIRVGTADVVSARALASLGQLFTYALPLIHSSSVGLFLKGRDGQREISDADSAWQFDAQVIASRTEAEAMIVAVRNLRPKPGRT